MTGAGFGLVAQESFVRRIEATVGAAMARVLGVVPARAVGSAVIFPIHGRFVGYTVTEGCTVAFLVAPFFVVAAMLTAGRRTPPTRAVGALTAVTVVFFGVNQARLFVVAASMRAWGYRSGYERSHVLLGTVLSTVGAVGGLLLFVWLLIREGGAKDDPTDRWAEAG